MNYFKVILNSQIIGVCTSSDCLRFQSANQMLIRTTKDDMEYLECLNKLYHAEWMKPIVTDSYSYIIATIVEINKEEYDILVPAIENAPVPVEEEYEEIVIPEQINPADEITLDYVREAKINEMSHICNQLIEAGFDVEIQNEIHHFSLTVQDQLNLITLSSMAAQGNNQIPYHADGELCKFYTAAEINLIVNQATMFKTYHTTYYNALKAYINSLDTIEEISIITYGTELPEEFQTDVLRAITQ